jgi:hypothetical protein
MAESIERQTITGFSTFAPASIMAGVISISCTGAPAEPSGSTAAYLRGTHG